MNTNTPRPTTTRQDVIKFLSENPHEVNPLIISKGIRRKMSKVRAEMDRMIKDGVLLATFDKNNYFTSLTLAENSNKNSARHNVRCSSTGKFAKKQEITLTEEEIQKDLQARKFLDEEEAYTINEDLPSAEEKEQVNQMLDGMKIPFIQLDPNADAVVLNEASAEEKEGFWSKIKNMFK